MPRTPWGDPDSEAAFNDNDVGQIDLSRPVIDNPDGSKSTERSITVEMDGEHKVMPSIVEGKQRTPKEAVDMHIQGKNPATGSFKTKEEAEDFAQRRSKEIGRRRGF